MLNPVYPKSFNKDIERLTKSGNYNIDKLKTIMIKLINEEILDPKYKDHKLIGKFLGCRECHIEPDWLLIYQTDDENIYFVRTGSHSELFK